MTHRNIHKFLSCLYSILKKSHRMLLLPLPCVCVFNECNPIMSVCFVLSFDNIYPGVTCVVMSKPSKAFQGLCHFVPLPVFYPHQFFVCLGIALQDFPK